MPTTLLRATAEGMPAGAHCLQALAPTTDAGLLDRIASTLASIPTWMELRIEAHQDAAAEVRRVTCELKALTAASTSIDSDNPPTWLLEAEQACNAAADREAAAMAELLAERPRSLKDTQSRARHLVAVGAVHLSGDQAMALLLSMTGGEA